MRKWLFRAGISAFVMSAFVSAGACGGDDSTSSGGSDSGGGGDATTSDVVTTGDSGSDAGSDAPGPGPATLTVFKNGAPYAGAKVVFYDDTGSPQPVITTGADGKATMTVGDNWSVTGSVMVSPTSPITENILTFIDIEPGDDLVMRAFSEKSAVNNVAVDEPTGAISGIDSVIYSAGCGSSSYSDGTPGMVNVSSACSHALGDGGSTFDLLVTAVDSNQNTIAYAQMTDVPVTGPGQHLTGLTWSAATNVDVVPTGAMPTLATAFGAQTTFVSGGLEFGNSSTFVQGDAGTLSLTLGTPMGSFANQASFQFAVDYGPVIDGFSYTAHRVLANDTTNYPVNFDTLAPQIQAGTLTTDDGGILGMSFTTAAPINTYDGEILSLVFYREVGDSGASFDEAFWTVVSPASNLVSAPQLTSDLTAFLPSMSTMYLTDFAVQKASTLGSYAAFRKGYARYPFYSPDESTPFTLEETGIIVPP